MNSLQLKEKIDLLPASLQEEVSDFVEFLMKKYDVGGITSEGEMDLTEKQKQELDNRYYSYLANPKNAVSIEIMKNRLQKKWDISF